MVCSVHTETVTGGEDMNWSEKLALRLLHHLEPERAHELAIRALQWGLFPMPRQVADERLQVNCCGLSFANPLGLAAGFDKNARAVPALFAIGFGLVEVGTVTPLAQPGNPRPRLFRLSEDEAIINRLGFNNEGQAAVRRRLERYARLPGRGVLGVNIGANKDSRDRIADYAQGARCFAGVADYLAVNISSPNTPGLRDLQGAEALQRLLAGVKAALAERGEAPPPVFVKIAPDMDDAALADIVEAAVEGGAAGLIVSNTTIERPESLRSPLRKEPGGLSGLPLFAPSTRMLARAYLLAAGRLRLIGAGGVRDAETAWTKIRAGADLVQTLSAFVYRGPSLVADILRGLLERMERAGHDHVSEAVGTAAEEWAERRLTGEARASASTGRPSSLAAPASGNVFHLGDWTKARGGGKRNTVEQRQTGSET